MNQIDTYGPTFDATETRVALVDAAPRAVLGAAERVDVARTVVQAIEALGLGDRLALAPARLAVGGREHVYGMAWRVDGRPAETVHAQQLRAFDRPGYVKVLWDVRVEAGSESGTLLSTTTRVVTTDDESRDRVEAAWVVFGPVAAALSKQALAAVKGYAEAPDELPCLGSLPVSATARPRRGRLIRRAPEERRARGRRARRLHLRDDARDAAVGDPRARWTAGWRGRSFGRPRDRGRTGA